MGMFSSKPKPTQSSTGRKAKHKKDPQGKAAIRGYHERALNAECREPNRWF